VEHAAVPELEISPEKVAWIILRARELETKVASFDEGDTETSEESGSAIYESKANDPTLAELKGFFATLNVDEEADLIAIAWIGRGTYGPEDWDEARGTALTERTTRTENYLLGMPLLADYLEDGLDALGIDAAEIEEGL
jgi:hypothetical protein